MSENELKVGGDDCHLCGGCGEVAFAPAGDPEYKQDVFGCPGCMQAERDEAIRQRDQLLSALEDSLRLIEMLMPGVRHLAIQDYAFLNDAPIRARAAIAKVKGN